MLSRRGFSHFLILAAGLFLMASLSLMAQPVHVQADGISQSSLPIIFREFSYVSVTGTVINASKPALVVPGALVCWKTLCDTSDDDGQYLLENIPSGEQTLTASKEGFVTVEQSVQLAGQTPNYQNIAIIPDVAISGVQYRILTTWNPTPCWPDPTDPTGQTCWQNDLDAHLWLEYPHFPVYHIFYLDRGDCVSMFPYACLERDEQNGYGPETNAIKQIQRDGIYYFGVLNYNQSQPGVPPISGTSALVRLYGLNGLEKTYQVPTNLGDQNFWYVFKMDGTVDPPIITDENCIIGYSDNPPQCP